MNVYARMAKARKPKNEEQKTDNSEAVVKHQKLCLSIDMEKRRIYGYLFFFEFVLVLLSIHVCM